MSASIVLLGGGGLMSMIVLLYGRGGVMRGAGNDWDYQFTSLLPQMQHRLRGVH